MINNVLLVSGTQQNDSVIYKHVSFHFIYPVTLTLVVVLLSQVLFCFFWAPLGWGLS